MGPTPLCLGVVSLLCSVSVRITPLTLNDDHHDSWYIFSVEDALNGEIRILDKVRRDKKKKVIIRKYFFGLKINFKIYI